MKTVIASLLLALLLLGMAGYLFYSGKTYEVRISRDQIEQGLAEKMPIQKTYLYIFDLTLDNPRVALEQSNGLIKAGLDIRLKILGREEAREFNGSVDASGALKYVAGDGQFYLSGLVIDKLTIEGLDPQKTGKVRGILQTALGEYLAARPIYTLKGDEFKGVAAKLVLRDVKVSDDELLVTLGL